MYTNALVADRIRLSGLHTSTKKDAWWEEECRNIYALAAEKSKAN